jgi:methylated-DNA-[protein]-cysteine S-methyltransferase
MDRPDVDPLWETMSYASLSFSLSRKRNKNEVYAALDAVRKRYNPKSIRAIAGANGTNAISIIIPCHRVIGSDGALTGYAGGSKAKEALLQLEGVGLSHGEQALF